MPVLWSQLSEETEICQKKRYNYKQGECTEIMTYDKDSLKKVLVKHNYNPQVMTPEWCNFALNILIVEKLDKILKKNV